LNQSWLLSLGLSVIYPARDWPDLRKMAVLPPSAREQ